MADQKTSSAGKSIKTPLGQTPKKADAEAIPQGGAGWPAMPEEFMGKNTANKLPET